MKKNNQITDIIMVGASGRMGQVICGLIEKSSEFVLSGAVENSAMLGELAKFHCPVSDNLQNLLKKVPGVIIDFTNAKTALNSARIASEYSRPIVIGSTGFDKKQKDELNMLARDCPIFLSSNMSIGVNVLLQFLPFLVNNLGVDYDIEILEIHHGLKKDAPSGTALMIGETIAKAKGWELEKCMNLSRTGIMGERPKMQIGFQAIRGGDVAGVHTIYFLGPGERIEITHQAHSRENFARGALMAAEWLKNLKAGKLYTMQDLLNSKNN